LECRVQSMAGGEEEVADWLLMRVPIERKV